MATAAAPITIEKSFHYSLSYTNDDDVGIDDDTIKREVSCDDRSSNNNNAQKELRLMMLGCEESSIYGPNENIAVSHSCNYS